MFRDSKERTRGLLCPDRALFPPEPIDERGSHIPVLRRGSSRDRVLRGFAVHVRPFTAAVLPRFDKSPGPDRGPNELPVERLTPGLERLDNEDGVTSVEHHEVLKEDLVLRFGTERVGDVRLRVDPHPPRDGVAGVYRKDSRSGFERVRH